MRLSHYQAKITLLLYVEDLCNYLRLLTSVNLSRYSQMLLDVDFIGKDNMDPICYV